MKRKITKKQETAYRLIHPSFGGLTYQQAAKKMGITKSAIRHLLERMGKVAPQLFPVLSLEHAEIWHLWSEEGFTCSEIAEIKETTERSVQAKLRLIKKKMGHKTQQRQMFNIDHVNELHIKVIF